nr:MAG TPA: hypothetical protein [Siphoviridae sp. ctpCx1]
MENNILNKEKVAELMEHLECKRYYSKCLKDVTELKEKMKYEATGIEIRFYCFGTGSRIAVGEKIDFHGDLSEGKLEVLNILAQHILSDMEANLELQIKRLESCLWDKFRYTEDAVPEKSVK